METIEYAGDATDPNLDMNDSEWPDCTAGLTNGIIAYCDIDSDTYCYYCQDHKDHEGL